MRVLSILIDQATSLGSHWTNLSKSIAVFPKEDLGILDEELAEDWQIESTDGVEILDLRQGGTVYQGDVACIVYTEWAEQDWNVEFRPVLAVDPLGFTSLRFAFHPGDSRGPFVSLFSVVINDMVVALMFGALEGIDVDPEVKDWQIVEIPLDVFDLVSPIESITFSGNLVGTFYLDDLRLVAATPPPSTTAVTEEHAATLPQSFTLDQNYPNPFNSDTVIRFSLPTSQDVELAIFNLAGQQVATLVSGVRQAGTYTVRWDGRDDDGWELASGVYLYRLRTGDGKQAETRKLALVR